MILGMSLSAFTALHTVIALIGIASGIVAVLGMLRSQRLDGWTHLFLAATILTSVTGFMFPFEKILPSHVFGVISLAVLTPVVIAFYVKRLRGSWRWIYITGSIFVLYLNAFVGIVQSFLKVSFLTPLAPTQSELPFVLAQGFLFVSMIVLGVLVWKRFRPEVDIFRT